MTEMVHCVNETHGIVDKFIGDAIMATWGAAKTSDRDAENAVTGALMMREALIKFNRGRGSEKNQSSKSVVVLILVRSSPDKSAPNKDWNIR
ncbi:adenylate/guanylate cyclase catalytic domain protein [Leptospira interrogans serovar Bataviae str. HAI135]|nr:adenylate/guanylate cyclase catalytic domain protein [Leptospira interrogans serovar Bataviae str. HAI135]